MYRIDPRRTDLAAEFREHPFGVHSPDLQAVLNLMRGGPVEGRYVLLMTQPHAQWQLARMTGRPPRPEPVPGEIFSSLEAAEWAVFRLRWEALTGERLELN